MPDFDWKSLLLDAEGVKATVYRRGELSLVAFGTVPWNLPRPAKVAEAVEAVLEATAVEPGERPLPVGKRDLTVIKIGRRKRRLYRIAAVDLEGDECWLDEVGWYVDTQKPPASWISNDPFGPYVSREAGLRDAYLAYRDEEA